MIYIQTSSITEFWYCIYFLFIWWYGNICSIYTSNTLFVGNFPRTLPFWKTFPTHRGTAKERDHLLKNTFERWAGKPVDFSSREWVCGPQRVQQHASKSDESKSKWEWNWMIFLRKFLGDERLKPSSIVYKLYRCGCVLFSGGASRKPLWNLKKWLPRKLL